MLATIKEGEDYKHAQDTLISCKKPKDRISIKFDWKKPIENAFNANQSVAYYTRSKNMGVGIVVRNYEGELVEALCNSAKYVASSKMAKIHAPWRAMKLCVEISDL